MGAGRGRRRTAWLSGGSAPARLLALLRNALACLPNPFTHLCVALRSLRLGFVGGRFEMVLGLLEMRLGHRGVLLEGGLGFVGGGFEMVLGLLEMRLGHRGVLFEGGLGFPSGRFEMVLGPSSRVLGESAAVAAAFAPPGLGEAAVEPLDPTGHSPNAVNHARSGTTTPPREHACSRRTQPVLIWPLVGVILMVVGAVGLAVSLWLNVGGRGSPDRSM
jgi:hypothetical protein